MGKLKSRNQTRSSTTSTTARLGGRYAVQGHSSSLILVGLSFPIKSQYVTSIKQRILTCTHLAPFSSYRAALVKLLYITKGHLSLKHSLSVISVNIAMNIIRRSRSFKVTDFDTNQTLVYIRLPVSK